MSEKATSFENRAMSSFPLSIGTSLALETLFDPRISAYDGTRKIPERIDVSNYSDIWINLSTLYRNMSGSMDLKHFLNYKPSAIRDFMLKEIEVINSLFQVEGHGHCLPHFYVNTYESFYKDARYQKITKRLDNTEQQKIIADHLSKSISLLLKETDEIYEFKDLVKPKSKCKSLMVSHYAYDLLSIKNFSSLDLLESHTGQLKKHYQWNTKLYPLGTQTDLSILPFLKKTLLIFGDRTLIQPMDIRIRRLVFDVAVSKKWNPFTTEHKINFDLNSIAEDYVRHFLQAL